MPITSSNSRIEVQRDLNGRKNRAPCFMSTGALAPEVRTRALPRGEAGQAFVELALVLPMLLLVIVGAAELGRLAYAAIEVNNAARAGVAYAAQSHTTANDTNNIELVATKEAATQDASDITGLTVTSVESCACENASGVIAPYSTCDSGTANLTNCPAPSRLVVYVTVTTTATVNTLFHLPAIPNAVTLQGTATMRAQP